MNVRFRAISVALVVLVFGYLALANLASKEARAKSDWLPDDGLRLGLDLQGGIHWVLGVKLEVALAQELDYLRTRLTELFEDESLAGASVSVDESTLTVRVGEPGDLARAKELAAEVDVLATSAETDTTVTYGLTAAWLREVRERGMLQVLEVMRRRIDDPVKGIPDSIVTRQGDDRILVQIPGGQIDRSRARELLKTTGFLEFKLVDDVADTRELLEAKYPDGIPDDQIVVPELDRETAREVQVYLVPRAAAITGKYLQDARVGFDQQQRPIVNFTWNSEGADIFRELTGDNINRQLAIILDKRVYSAPNIRSRIGARGQIEGRFTSQEAADLAVVLRAGSLSVPVVIEEERTVGPALGADSIRRGVIACAIGLLLVILFAIVYYKLSGVYASAALAVNLLLIMGVMSLAEATLTLPGMAGLVLTVGMAIDANVIIFERIREELRSGKAVKAAIQSGFARALWTVLDANITTLITAIVLFQYGTGPIKGFAVTLSIGIVTSLFAALVVTRLLFALHPGERRVEALSI